MNRASTMLVAALLLTSTSLVTSAPAQDLQAKYEQKISEDWFVSAGWTDDYDEARAKAKESGKPIVAYFTRSYSP